MYLHHVKVDCWSERDPLLPHKTVEGSFPSEYAELDDAAGGLIAIAVEISYCESEEYHFGPDDEVVGEIIKESTDVKHNPR